MNELIIPLNDGHRLVLAGDYTPASRPTRHEPGTTEAFEPLAAWVEEPRGRRVEVTALLERIERAVPGFAWGAWAEVLALAQLTREREERWLERALARREVA